MPFRGLALLLPQVTVGVQAGGDGVRVFVHVWLLAGRFRRPFRLGIAYSTMRVGVSVNLLLG